MNQTASNLAKRKELQGTVQNGRFLKAERGGGKDVIDKECIVTGKPPS